MPRRQLQNDPIPGFGSELASAWQACLKEASPPSDVLDEACMNGNSSEH